MVKKKINLAMLLTFLSVLSLSGCGVSQKEYDALETQLASVQKEYDATRSELASVQNGYDATKLKLESVQKEYDAIKSQLATAQDEIKKLQGTLATQSTTLTQTQKRVTDLEKELNNTMDTKLVQYFRFFYQGVRYDWTLPIPLRTYFYYKAKSRLADVSKYGALAADAYADSLVNVLVNNLKDATITYNLRQIDVINMVATFIQSLPGIDKNATTPYDGVPRYPIETIMEQQGDCEDTSILAAAILVRMGYDVVFFVYEQPKHIAVGIYMPGSTGYSWEYKGKRYFYLETTGGKWQLGDSPFEYSSIRPTIYPASS